MTTPLQRAARVLCEQAGRDPDEVCIGEGKATGQTWMGWEAFVEDARAVIAAIREPSQHMMDAGEDTDQMAGIDGPHGDTPPHLVWPAMIDALLEEGK